MKKLLSVILAAVLTFSCVVPAFADDFFSGSENMNYDNILYVSVNGNDSADGSVESPLATLEGAKNKAKSLSGTVAVIFREGTYTFNSTVSFTADDKENVTYKAYNGEKVIFTAGVPYTGFEECTVNGVKAFRKYVGPGADFNVLFNSETTLPRTRYPETGYLHIANVENSYSSNYEQVDDDNKPYHCGYEEMDVNPADIEDFRNPGDAVVRILHFWKDEMLNIKSYDSASGHMVFTKASSMTLKAGERYFIENVFEALNTPGEWYLDKPEGVLYYIPKEGEEASTLTLWGSETEILIKISGTDGITFENIIFRGNGFNINPDRDFSQAAYDAPACVMCENASCFNVRNCEFRDIAAGGVFMGYVVTDSSVENCIFSNIGAQGVYIRGERVSIDSDRITKNIKVINNLIEEYGRVYFNAVGVLVIDANSVDVCNNEIHDGYYTAISVGWVWGYDANITYNCKICDNLIYNIGQGWLSDMGGIYTLGNQPGTVLSGNVIHNVAADPDEGGYGGWGIYLDEGSSFITVEKNLVYSCGSDAYHLHYGSTNTVRNNIFALSGESSVRICSAPQRVTRLTEKYPKAVLPSAEFTNNIYLTDKHVRAYSYWNDEAIKESGNIFWDLTNGEDVLIGYYSSADHATGIQTAARKGYLTDAHVFNPNFTDAAAFDFSFADDSAVRAVGFEPWDYSSAGTQQGTVIGISTQGGTTAYNADSASVPLTTAKEPFHFFMNLLNRIIAFFQKIFA